MTTRSMTSQLSKEDTRGGFDWSIIPPRVYRHYNEMNIIEDDNIKIKIKMHKKHTKLYVQLMLINQV